MTAIERQVDLILDSGAFSAWRQQETLKVEDYIAYINEFRDYVAYYVNLDVIPGAFGKKPSHAEVEESARLGWENLMVMRKAGLKPIPVFHHGERRYWLEKMIGEGFDYIGISPANDRTTDQKREWLDEVFGYLCGKPGYPTIRTHGFGVTALPLLYRYPWYSSDSISWILFGAYGMFLVPVSRNGVYDYTVSPHAIYCSNRSEIEGGMEMGSNVVAHTLTYKALGPAQRAMVDKYITEQGFTIEELSSNYLKRLHLNLKFFKAVCQSYEPQPFRCSGGKLFSKGIDSPHGATTNQFGHLRLVFSTTTSREHSELLQIEGVRERLISWYHVRKGNVIDLPDYVKTGLVRVMGKVREKRLRARPRAVLGSDKPRMRLRIS